jgi:hypothetical protein
MMPANSELANRYCYNVLPSFSDKWPNRSTVNTFKKPEPENV